MPIFNTTDTYGSVSKFLHWMIALLVICMLVIGFFMGDMPEEYQGVVYNTHKLTGLTILMLMILRLCWALINVKPLMPAGSRWWEKISARIVHLALYVTVIAMPLAGWIGASAAGKPPHLGGMKFLLPIQESKSLAEASFDMHKALALTIIGLLCLHIIATLYHHFIRKDNVWRRMWFN